MYAIEIEDFSKSFKGKRGAKVEAVKGLSLAVSPGEVFGFLGPNGAGKSTTIKMLMGLIRPTGGRATIMGRETESDRSRIHVGYLPENPSFYDFLTAVEYLSFIGKAFGMSNDVVRQRMEVNLKLLDLWDARNRPVRGYSKGMVQRLGLAQAMIHDPDVYILDEPMSGLDPVGRALVKDIIVDLKKRGKAIFFSTHITADVETVSDRVGIILKGALRCIERVDSILTSGIAGYHIRILEPESGEQKVLDISRERLLKAMADLQASGQEIILIEPKRKNLEAFFLNIVKGGKC